MTYLFQSHSGHHDTTSFTQPGSEKKKLKINLCRKIYVYYKSTEINFCLEAPSLFDYISKEQIRTNAYVMVEKTTQKMRKL